MSGPASGELPTDPVQSGRGRELAVDDRSVRGSRARIVVGRRGVQRADP